MRPVRDGRSQAKLTLKLPPKQGGTHVFRPKRRPVAWPASHIPVLSPVFRVAFVKFGGLLALVVLFVSSNVYPKGGGRVFPKDMVVLDAKPLGGILRLGWRWRWRWR